MHNMHCQASNSTPTAVADVHDWAYLLSASYVFYEAQQSGPIPSWNRAARANGKQHMRLLEWRYLLPASLGLMRVS
jgi:hypothetical protein